MMHEREEEAVIEISAHRKNTENATNDKFYTKNHIQQILYRKIQKILLMVFLPRGNFYFIENPYFFLLSCYLLFKLQSERRIRFLKWKPFFVTFPLLIDSLTDRVCNEQNCSQTSRTNIAHCAFGAFFWWSEEAVMLGGGVPYRTRCLILHKT